MSIAQFAVSRRVTVAMLATAIIVLGIFAFPRLPVNLLPTFTPPVVSVTVNYGTVSPETMETTITRPVENAVSRVSGIDYLQSNSFQGQTTIRATFKFGTDINVAATDIQQQIARIAKQLPNDPNLQQPVIQKADPNSIPIARLYITDATRTLRDLSDLFTNQLNDEFSAVSGVGSVTSSGGQTRAIMVEPNEAQLAGYGLGVNDLIAKIGKENVDTPAGLAAIGPQEYIIRTSALFKTAAEIGDTVVTIRNGAPVYIRDVAKVTDGIQEQRSFSRLSGVPAISLIVTAQPDANAVAVADGVNKKIAELQKRYPSLHFGQVFDQRGFIVQAVTALQHTALYGAVLAVLIILLFLHSWRSTLIVAVSLPVSVMGTLFAAYIFHQSLNVMTLGGLALAVGLIVDDAVVVIENIFRHLAKGESPLDAARNATAQIMTAVMASSITVVTVFVPLLLIPGLQGLIFGPFAIVVMTGIAISLMVAVTTVPMLSSIMLHSEAHAVTNGHAKGPYARFSASFDRTYDRFERAYTRLLTFSLDHAPLVLAIGFGFFIADVVAVKAGIVATETFPASDSRYARFDLRTPNGTSLAVTNQVSQLVEQAFRDDKRVVNVGATAGSGFGGGGSRAITNQSSLSVTLQPDITGVKAAAFVNEWQTRLGGFSRRPSAARASAVPNPQASATPEQRAFRRKLRQALVGSQIFGRTIDIVQQVVSHGSDALEIQLYGPDYTKLYALAQRAIPSLLTIPGVIRPSTNVTASQPEIDIKVDRRKAAQLGFSTGDIGNIITTATSGTIASYFQVNGIQYPIYVQFPAADRRSLAAIAGIQLTPPPAANGTGTTAGGQPGARTSESFGSIPLGAIATITTGTGPSQIARQNKQRRIDIDAPVVGQPLGTVVAKATDVMNRYPLPAGYRWQWGPAITQNNDTFGALALVVLLAISLIYMLLAAQFESFLDPLVIMMAVPLSLVGIVLSLLITHRSFGLTAFIGSLLLVGIAVKNAILVIEFTKQLRRGGESARAAILQAGPMRLRPIMMTTLATIGGMLPIALGIEAGSETQAPLGTVVIGGLITSTLLSLVVVPTLYLLVATHIEPRFSKKPPTFRKNGKDGEAIAESQRTPVHAGTLGSM
ncbi:MAG: efflux RND transporter permease subunit [Candidatus Velthaea sp.]